MEHVYQLNIPSFEEIANLTPEVKDKYFPPIDLTKTHLYRCYLNVAQEILKPEFFNFQGINWLHILLFHKSNGHTSPIHTDMEIGSTHTPWGINWITGGQCVMEYWSLDKLEISNSPIVYNTDDDSNTPVKYNINLTPLPDTTYNKVYYLEPGKAYLVDATTPHRVTGFGSTTISLRTNQTDYNWETIVEKIMLS